MPTNTVVIEGFSCTCGEVHNLVARVMGDRGSNLAAGGLALEIIELLADQRLQEGDELTVTVELKPRTNP